MPLLLNDIRNVFSYKSHSQAELRVKASDTERERLAIVLAETNFKVDALEKDATEGKDKKWIFRDESLNFFIICILIKRTKFSYLIHKTKNKNLCHLEF